MHSNYCQPNPCASPAMAYYVPYCPWCGLSFNDCLCWSRRMPACYQVQQEISADPSGQEKTVMVGGASPVGVTLEYLPVEGAKSPSVKVVLSAPDGTATTIDESSITAGYHVKDDLTPLAPGTLIQLTVTECIARLRWLETFNYKSF